MTPPTREFLRHWLETMGYDVKEAPTADVALAMMLTEPAAIILLDIDMPGHDGLWFAERVKSEWPSTAIVFASAVDKIVNDRARALAGCRRLRAEAPPVGNGRPGHAPRRPSPPKGAAALRTEAATAPQ